MLIALNPDTYVDADAIDVVRIARTHGDNAQIHEIQIWIMTNCLTTGKQYVFDVGDKAHAQAQVDLDQLVERIREHRVLSDAARKAWELIRELESAERML